MGFYVSQVIIVDGNSNAEARGKCPSGYTLVPIDLNEGAGGRFIYLCFTKNNDLNPIVSMALSFSSNKNPESYGCGTGLYIDLNKGAGGNYIYLFVETFNHADYARLNNQAPSTAPWNQFYTTGDPISDITVKSGSSRPATPAGYTRVEGYSVSDLTSVDPDLNRGAGGKYIYLYYKRSPKPKVKQH